MRVVITGHSLVHPRQYKLADALGKIVDVINICPSQWGNEFAPKNAIGIPPQFLDPRHPNMMQYFLGQNMFTEAFKFTLPELIYCQEETFSLYAKQCALAAEALNCKLIYFNWENKNIELPTQLHEIEKENLAIADLVICGNPEAEIRVHNLNPDVKTKVIPQTGIDIDLFKPISNVEKKYDIGYIGRYVPEKVDIFHKFVQTHIYLKALAVGGRGDVTPISQNLTVVPWSEYKNLPQFYNKMKVFMHLPYSQVNGFQEQFVYTIGEALACGLPVICSNNGSMPSIYGTAPNVFFVDEGEKGLVQADYYVNNIIDHTYGNLKSRSEEGQQWVKSNLSLQAIADILSNTFKEVLNE